MTHPRDPSDITMICPAESIGGGAALYRKTYLLWLADKRGIDIPANAKFSIEGVTVGGEMILPMPGYGQSETVEMEELDATGAVIRSSRIALKKGKLPYTAKKVREIAGPIAKTRKASVKVSAPVTAAIVETEGNDMSNETTARLDTLEAAIGRIGEMVASLAAQTPAPRPAEYEASREEKPHTPGQRNMREEAPTPISRDLILSAEETADIFIQSLCHAEQEPIEAAAKEAEMARQEALEEAEAERAILRARIARLEEAFTRMAQGRREQGRASRMADERAMRALAAARESDDRAVTLQMRADEAERQVEAMKPLLDVLDAIRPQPDYVAPGDDGFCKPRRGAERFPRKASA